MLQPIAVPEKTLDDYRELIGDERVEAIHQLARPLRGARVLHLNATGFGGGVAELLTGLVPLMRSVGLDADWQVMVGAPELWEVTKAMHNLLQGATVADATPLGPRPPVSANGSVARPAPGLIMAPWTEAMMAVWRRYNEVTAERIDGEYDFVVVHDPQPAGVLSSLRERSPRPVLGHWVWRCHIDLTRAQPRVWDF